jgi:hypothetical protein
MKKKSQRNDELLEEWKRRNVARDVRIVSEDHFANDNHICGLRSCYAIERRRINLD